MKKTLIYIYEIAYFMLISVPLACILFSTAHSIFELKRIILWLRTKHTH
jgi:hypothetical protein